MVKRSGNPTESSPAEIAILAKWALHEAWLYCIEVLEQRLKDQQISVKKKMKKEEMYNTLFQQTFYIEVRTMEDIDKLLKDSRKMLAMLKKLDESTWAKFMMENM